MNKINKKVVITIVLAIVVIVGIFFIVKNANSNKTEFKGEGKTQNDIKVNNIEFKDITKEYDNGITTIRANVYNHTKETKSINAKIILKNDKGEELTTMIQKIENIEPERKKLLATGIMGDYSNVSKIEIVEISDDEINQY